MEQESVLREMQEEFRELKLEVYESRSQVVKLQTELSKSQAKVVKLENIASDNQTKIVRVEEELSNRKARTATLQEDMANNKALIATLQEDLCNSKAKNSTLQDDIGNNKAKISTLEEEMANTISTVRIAAVEKDMDNTKVRIDNMEDEIANSKEKVLNVEDDLNNWKSKIVKLEMKTKSLVKDIAMQGSAVSGEGDRLLTSRHEEKLKKKVKAVKKKCDELSKGLEQMRKLQHILNGFILNAQKSSLQTYSQSQATPVVSQSATQGAEDLPVQLEDNQETQHLPAEIEATLPDPEDSVQVAFSKCKLLVRDHRIDLRSGSKPYYIHLAALEWLAGENDGPSWNIGCQVVCFFREEVKEEVDRKKSQIKTSYKAMIEYIRQCKMNFIPDGKVFYVQDIPEIASSVTGILTIKKSIADLSLCVIDSRGIRRNIKRSLDMDSIKDYHFEDPNWFIMVFKDDDCYQIKSPERQEILDAFKTFHSV